MRWGLNDINNVNDTCYQVCGQFIDGGQQEIAQSDCGQKCKMCWNEMAVCKGKNECSFPNKVPVMRLLPRIFQECLAQTGDKDQALQCCLTKCGNYEEQEMCITAYNALQKTSFEHFLSPGNSDYSFILVLILILVGLYYYKK